MTNIAKAVNANGLGMIDLGDLPGFGPSTRVPIADNDPLRSTFACFLGNITPAANPTDLIQIRGSASSIVRVRSLVFTGAATAASNIFINTVRRSTPSTGGTSANQTLVNRDNLDNLPTATVQLFSANPGALGTLIGIADGGRLNIAPAANGGIDRMLLQYSWLNDKAPILRGVNDCLCINLGGLAWPAGGALDVNIVLSEDAI